jgi:hypothetical protein
MVEKDTVSAVLNMAARRISFMKENEFQEEIETKGKLQFTNLWNNSCVKITVEIKDFNEETKRINQSSQCSEESGACENPAEH